MTECGRGENDITILMTSTGTFSVCAGPVTLQNALPLETFDRHYEVFNLWHESYFTYLLCLLWIEFLKKAWTRFHLLAFLIVIFHFWQSLDVFVNES